MAEPVPESAPQLKLRSATPGVTNRNLHQPSAEQRRLLFGVGVPRGRYAVETVRSLATLTELAEPWQELADDTAEPNPFYEPWNALPALRSLAPEQGIEVVLVFSPAPADRPAERRLCGLFPLERRRAAGSVPVSMLGLWAHPYSYLGVPLVRRGHEAEVLRAFLDWLSEGGARRSLLRMEAIPGDGPLRLCLVDELCRRGWHCTVTQTYTRAFLRKDASSEAYLERALSAKRRREFRRQARLLAEEGPVRFRELSEGDDLFRWIEDFVTLENSGWKGREQVSVGASDAHRRYFQELLIESRAANRLQLLSLEVNGRPAAMKVNLLSRAGAVAFKITYDEKLARFSPGVLLELENLNRVHARQDIPWMDSCAAPNRFLLNHLWTARREMQTLLLSTGHPLGSLVTAGLPLARWVQARFSRKQPAPWQGNDVAEEASVD